MSLAVMAVRLAIKAALAPPVEVGWPTLAEGRIFDSRFDLLDGRGGERTPLVVFAVETVDGLAFSAQLGAGRGDRSFDANARLVISAQVTSKQAFLTEEGHEFDAEAADLLDQELADLLAVLQEQIWVTLKADPLFGRVVRRITRLDAEPYPASETGDKLAVLANSYFLEPLGDGEKAMTLVRDGLPLGSPVRVRADLALDRIAATRAILANAALARSGLVGRPPFAVDSLAQGVSPSPPEPAPEPPAPAEPDFNVTLDPEDPIP